MYYGCDYYPEYWPKDRWKIDAKMMADAGFNIVRIGEFAWAAMETKKENWNFEWLDEVLDILIENGISVVLCTPTCAPPKWLIDSDPGMLLVDKHGMTRGYGTRNSCCYNNENWLFHTNRVVSKMAERYKNHKAVIAWQLDNEFGNHKSTLCYCEDCRREFITWLQKRYGTLDALNYAWGTAFWSQNIYDWNEIYLPKETTADTDPGGAVHNVGLLLDFQRFRSDTISEYASYQIDILKKNGVTVPITTNFMGCYPDVNYYDVASRLDFISWDNYPCNRDLVGKSLENDLMYGLSGKPFWIMEQWSGPCGWNTMSSSPKPGEIALWSFHAIAHGAKTLSYFRWRACPSGTEQYWHGILDHDGIPRRRYDEVKTFGTQLQKINKVIDGSVPIHQVAIIKDYEALWSHRFQPHVDGFSYDRLLTQYYSGVMKNGSECIMTGLHADLSAYKVVILPAYNLVSDEEVKKLEDYASNGGTVVITFRSGTREKNNRITLKPQPGYFAELAGVELTEFTTLQSGETVSLGGMEGNAKLWCDILKPTTSKTIATYDAYYFKGAAAITRNQVGKGAVWYVGCHLDDEATEKLVAKILREADVAPDFPYQEDVQIIKHAYGNQTIYFAMNFSNEKKSVSLNTKYLEMLTDQKISELILEPQGFALLADMQN